MVAMAHPQIIDDIRARAKSASSNADIRNVIFGALEEARIPFGDISLEEMKHLLVEAIRSSKSDDRLPDVTSSGASRTKHPGSP